MKEEEIKAKRSEELALIRKRSTRLQMKEIERLDRLEQEKQIILERKRENRDEEHVIDLAKDREQRLHRRKTRLKSSDEDVNNVNNTWHFSCICGLRGKALFFM
jgi:hypothetical protein